MEAVSAPTRTDAVTTAVFKKQLDVEKSKMSQLLESVPAQPVAPGPAHLGRSVDLYA
ncbi:MAG: putative motility protein [Bacteroidota bacterium]